MSLSKPLFNALSFYFEQLFTHPLRTKSVTSCILASSANIISQRIVGSKQINYESLLAYAIFGLVFGGSMPHMFYKVMEQLLVGRTRLNQFLFFGAERLIFMPLFQALSLYMLAIFEGKSHDGAVKNLMALYGPIVKANWKYLSLFVFINIKFVPPIFRVLVGNLIGFAWVIFISSQRRKFQKRIDDAKQTKIIVTDSDAGTSGVKSSNKKN